MQAAVAQQTAQLGHADTLRGHGHHHPREARARLAQLQRLHCVAAGAELCCEALQAVRRAHREGVGTELGTEPRVGEQALDQLAGASGFLVCRRARRNRLGHQNPKVLRKLRNEMPAGASLCDASPVFPSACASVSCQFGPAQPISMPVPEAA